MTNSPTVSATVDNLVQKGKSLVIMQMLSQSFSSIYSDRDQKSGLVKSLVMTIENVKNNMSAIEPCLIMVSDAD